MKMLRRTLQILTYILLIALVASFFAKNMSVGLKSVSEETLVDPVQISSADKTPIEFKTNGYNFEATPLYDYKLSGIVAHKMGYSLLENNGADQTAPYDLCIVWGENVKNKIYLEKTITFGQDQRFCFISYTGNTPFYSNQFSNNHLLIKDSTDYQTEKSINVGDEVEISGHLVNVRATKVGDSSKYFTWDSSTSREDTGNGACEVILVDSIKIKTRANPIPVLVYQISIYLLPTILVIRFIIFLFSLRRKRKKVVPINFTRT